MKVPATGTQLPDGRWRVEWAELGVEGTGATQEEAAKNFAETLGRATSDPAVASRMAELVGSGPTDAPPEMPEAFGNLPSVTAAEFDELVSSETPVLVDFWASWCRPCAVMAPALVALQEELSLNVVKVDVEAEGELARRCEIAGVPTLLLYREGTLLHRIAGAQPVHQLKAELAPFMS